MKNIKESQLEKCIYLTQTKLEDILSETLQKAVTVNVGPYGLDPYAKDEDIDDDLLYDTLSEYFDVTIVSIHVDYCDSVGIWAVYKEEDSIEETQDKKGEKMIITIKEDVVSIFDEKDVTEYDTSLDSYSQYLPSDGAKFLWKNERMALEQCESDVRNSISLRFPDASETAINQAVSAVMDTLAPKIKQKWRG